MTFPLNRARGPGSDVALLPADYEQFKTGYLMKYTRTMFLDAPPRDDSIRLMANAANSVVPSLTDAHRLILESLTIHCASLEFDWFIDVGRLLSARYLHVVCTDAAVWTLNVSAMMLDESWAVLENAWFEECLPIYDPMNYDDVSDFLTGQTFPFTLFPRLTRLSISARKWDGYSDVHGSGGLLASLFSRFPNLDSWPDTATLEVGVAGKTRFEYLRREYEAFIAKDSHDNQRRWNRLVSMTLLPGDMEGSSR